MADPTIEFLPASPDCVVSRPSGQCIDRIVIHVTEGSFNGTIGWFRQGRGGARGDWPTAAHYVISEKGRIVQMVADEKKCWHATRFNSRSIGIEHEGHTAKGGFSDAMLEASAQLVAMLCRRHGLSPDRVHLVGHNEVPGATHTDPGPHWPWDAYLTRVQAIFGAGGA